MNVESFTVNHLCLKIRKMVDAIEQAYEAHRDPYSETCSVPDDVAYGIGSMLDTLQRAVDCLRDNSMSRPR